MTVKKAHLVRSFKAVHSLLLFLVPIALAGRPCEESDMCSVGTSRQWVGDIKDSAKFREMLEAVAFKKELIISLYQMQGDAPFVWLDQVLGLHYELLDMGYAHHLYISHSAATCAEIAAPGMNCVWDSSVLPGSVMSGETALWHNRWKFMARAVRLGYNVMSVDTDFMFFRDPYVHFKTPPLADVQLLCNPEGGSAFNCNGGFIYSRNAKPDGATAWVFMEVVRSSLRRGDDGFKYLSQWTHNEQNCLTFDQSLISDAICSAAVGRPVYPSAVSSCKHGAQFTTPAGGALTFDQVMENVNTIVRSWDRIQRVNVQPDSHWLTAAGFKEVPEPDATMLVGRLMVPNIKYGYPDPLGGRTWPDGPNRPLSDAWEAMLKADCPDCPWWPEDRALPNNNPLSRWLGADWKTPVRSLEAMKAFHDPSVPTEMYAQTPMWLSSSLSNSRRGVVLGPRSARQGYMVLGHVHSWHLQSSRLHKTMLRKVYGRYNWTLGTEMARRAGHHSPYLMARNVTRVLALHPDMDLSRTRSWAEFSAIMAGLFQVAHLSRRAVRLPELPCQTAWLHNPDALKNDGQERVCIAPTFWKDMFRYPLPLTLAVDSGGELVGGWARKRNKRRRLGEDDANPHSQHDVSRAGTRQQREDIDVGGPEWDGASGAGHRRAEQGSQTYARGRTVTLIAPAPDGYSGREEHAPHHHRSSGHQQPSSGAGSGLHLGIHQPHGTGGSHGSNQRWKGRRMQQAPRALSQQDGAAAVAVDPDDPAWWSKQRYVFMLPALWDSTCTLDMHAIIGPEFFHWLKHNPEGKRATVEPSDANTVFLPSPDQPQLLLQPPPAPGGDAGAVPPGTVVPPSDDPGWSLADVQVTLPAAQVVAEMHRLAEAPLVYLGHPVMVVKGPEASATAPPAGGPAAADSGPTEPLPKGASITQSVAHALHQHLHTVRHLAPNEALQRVNQHLTNSRCKAVWEEVETFHGKLVDLTRGVPAQVNDQHAVVVTEGSKPR